MTATDRTVLDQLVSETKIEMAPEMKDDEFFELFCAQSLLIDQQLEPEEIKFGLVGSDSKLKTGSDGGIDAIYVLVNGKPVRSAEDAEVLKSAFKQNVEIEVILIQASREEVSSCKDCSGLKTRLRISSPLIERSFLKITMSL